MNRIRIPLVLVFIACVTGDVLAGRRRTPIEPGLGDLDKARFEALVQVMSTEQLATGQKLYKAKDYGGALKAYQAFEKAIDTTKAGAAKAAKPHVVWMVGVCHLREKRLEEARKEFQRALGIAKHPLDAALADYYIGTSLKFAGNTAEAIAHYDKFVANMERKKCMKYYNKALDWLYRQYVAQKGTSEEWTKRYHDFLHYMAMARPKGPEWFELYQYHLKRDELDQCMKVAGYRMSPTEAAAKVFEDVLGKAVAVYEAASDEAAKKKAREGVSQTVAAQKKKLMSMEGLDEDAKRTLFLGIVKTQAKCLMPREACAGIMAWMKSRPNDKIALFTFDGFVDKEHPPDVQAYNKVFLDYMEAHPDEKQVVDLYSATVVRSFKERDSALKVLKSCGMARDWHYAEVYTGWQDDEAEPRYVAVSADEKETLKRRLIASRWLGLRYYDSKNYRETVSQLQLALELQAKEGRLFGHERPAWRHKLADCHRRQWEEDKAGALWAANCERRQQPRDPVLRAIAMYEGYRYVLKTGNERAKQNAERTLRGWLGQDLRSKPPKLELRFSENEEIRKLQEKAKTLLEGYKVNLDLPPARNKWR